jgi:putative flippase GtrA
MTDTVPSQTPVTVDPTPDHIEAPPADGRLTVLLAAHPLLQRITGYSAGSVIAAMTSEAAFAITLGWLHAGTTVASAAGFVGGAVPNYFFNRRWAWRADRRGRSRRSELLLYVAVSLASFAVSAVATDWADDWARTVTSSGGWRVALVALTYLGVSALFFVGKFVAYELIVFTKGSRGSQASPGSPHTRRSGGSAGSGGPTGDEAA